MLQSCQSRYPHGCSRGLSNNNTDTVWVYYDNGTDSGYRVGKVKENCLAEFDAHWRCLEFNNQVSVDDLEMTPGLSTIQYYQACRKPEKTLNQCVFEKLVSLWVQTM